MVLKSAWVGGLLALLLSGAVSSNAATLETRAWPVSRKCDECVGFQFGRLEMRLPRGLVSKIFVTSLESPSLGFVPGNGDERMSYSWLTLDAARLRERYEKLRLLEKHPIGSPADYLDALGTAPAADDKALVLARRVERIDRARSFVKLSRGNLRVYFVDAAEVEDRRLYFAIDGDDALYLLAGPFPSALVNAMLSNLRVRDR